MRSLEWLSEWRGTECQSGRAGEVLLEGVYKVLGRRRSIAIHVEGDRIYAEMQGTCDQVVYIIIRRALR